MTQTLTQEKLKTRVGTLYLEGVHFADEANKTVGEPCIGPEASTIIGNRRLVTDRLSDLGKRAIQRVKEYFKKEYNLEIKLKWSIHAGCTMCPCSPGFKIYIMAADKPWWLRTHDADDHRLDVWVNTNGSLGFGKRDKTRIKEYLKEEGKKA